MKAAVDSYLQSKGFDRLSVKAVFFDMDGVLFDSMPYHAAAWTEVMQGQGIPFTEHDAYMNEGRTGASTINEYFLRYKGREASEQEIQALYKQKSDLFNAMNSITPMCGVDQVIAFFRSKGIACYVVTGSGQKSLFEVLENYYPTVFDPSRMVTAYDVRYGKPHPEPYLMALEKSGLESNEVMVIENAPLGVKSGVAAGLFTVAVNTGVLKVDELRMEGANMVLDDMKSLLNNLQLYYEKV